MDYVISVQLRQQVHYVLATEKINFAQSVQDKFSKKLDDLENDLEEQAMMMSFVYQLYNHMQLDSFELFLRLNNRFEYDNHWRFDMKVISIALYHKYFLKYISRLNKSTIEGPTRHFEGKPKRIVNFWKYDNFQL